MFWNPRESEPLQQERLYGNAPLPDAFLTDGDTGEIIDTLNDESAVALFALQLNDWGGGMNPDFDGEEGLDLLQGWDQQKHS